MSVAHSLDRHSYLVSCAACSREYDAVLAPWCHCVTKDIGVACPHCLVCICRAGRTATRDFWLHAPALLRELRAEEKARRRPVTTPWRSEKPTVLIVDDDEEIRLLAAYELQGAGYRTLEASSPAEAMRVVEESRPDVVLTDALMPGGDGRELCRAIKLRHPRVKVAVMTSLYTSRRYETEAHRVFHSDAYLAKPIEIEKLLNVIERLAGVDGENRS